MLTVIDEADCYDLVDLDDVKQALGVIGGTEDFTLPPLISAASQAIAKACNRVFLSETVEETLRIGSQGMTILERYPVSSIVQVTENGSVLTADDYEVDSFTGILTRLRNDCPSAWCGGKLVVRYVAGYDDDEIPADLVQATIMLVSHYRSVAGRDPLVRSIAVTDVDTTEYQIPTDDNLPPPVLALIDRYRKQAGA